MKADIDAAAGKRPLKLALNEQLASQANVQTDNLAGVVESTVNEWSRFNSKAGSMADEYSSL